MTKLLADPRLFNFVILTLYALSMVRWAFAGKWVDVWYWFSAFSITACMTWGYKH